MSDFDEGARLKWFVNTCFVEYLFPMIEKGEEKAEACIAFCRAWLAAWDEEQDTDLSDHAVAMTESCLRCWRLMVALISMDLLSMDDAQWDDIDFISKLRHSSEKGIEVSLSMAIYETDFYKDKLDKLVNHRSQIQRTWRPCRTASSS